MSTIDREQIIEQLLGVLDEAFPHPKKPWSYFTDNVPDTGYEGLLASLSAGQASQRRCNSSISAHVNHMIFALETLAAWIRGERTFRDWTASWNVHEVDSAEWERMKSRLKESYLETRSAFAESALSSPESFGGAVGMIAHAAYHLSAIRYLLRCTDKDV